MGTGTGGQPHERGGENAAAPALARAGAGEREIIFTGVGGQGIQLMAKVLAEAAVAEGRHVMLFGSYQGMMRGGPSASTVVIGNAEIEAPPIVPYCWALVALHGEGLDGVLPKLRPGGVLFTNATLVSAPPRADLHTIALPATQLAERAGNVAGTSMVALGAFVAATRLVALDAVADAMHRALPPHRRARAAENARFLRLGAEQVGTGAARAAPPTGVPA